MTRLDFIQQSISYSKRSIDNTIELLEGGATVPFISRYRKEATGGLDELEVAEIRDLNKLYQQIIDRQKTILSAIEEQDKLTEELKNKILTCFDTALLEDLYLPFKQKRKTKADIARERGLEVLAKIIMTQNNGDVIAQATRFIKGEVKSTEEAILGAQHIIAEWISEHLNLRGQLRKMFENKALLTAKLVKSKEEEAQKYRDYYDHSELLKRIPSHRFLAIYRGAKEGFLRMKVAPEKENALELVERIFVKAGNDAGKLVAEACKDAYDRLIAPSLENEVIQSMKEQADKAAIKIFSTNLEQLLLAPPLGQKRILAIDPGFRTGCKVVCLDEQGSLLTNVTIFPHPPQREASQAKSKIAQLVQAYKIDAIAIGDGTAGRETEALIKQIRFDRDVQVFVVREDGASIYSASTIGRKEFPDYDITVRGSVSIGRRLMDPLAELVKIDPKSIGVGQYQHEVNQSFLKDALDDVIVSCVNRVGVDLNTASPYLLGYVSGLGPQLAENIVEYRNENGAFLSRESLKKVKRLGDKAYEQSAGFLRIRDAAHPLDNSAVHPESYKVVAEMSKKMKVSIDELIGNDDVLSQLKFADFSSIDKFTFDDIIKELKKPGLDPRKKAAVLEFDDRIKNIEDLKEGMEINGIITNVTSFGAFVNIGIKENGLIHKSNMGDQFVEDPSDVVKLHQHVRTKVLTVDVPRKRIGLGMI
jgi:protein Tex